MQPLGKTSTKGTAYTASQVVAMMVNPAVVERWVVDRLDQHGNTLADISSFVDAAAMTKTGAIKGNQFAPVSGQRTTSSVMSIEHDSTRAVKRTLNMRCMANVTLSPLQDMLRIHYQLQAPDGGWLDWALGTFLLQIPDKEINPGFSWLQVKGTDVTQLLVDAAAPITWTVGAGISYLAAIQSVINSYGGGYQFQIQIPDPGLTLPATRSWKAGTSRLSIVNDLLAAVNYEDLWADEWGTLRSQSIPIWNLELPGYTFDSTSALNNLGYPIKEVVDLSNAYNQILVVGADPRTALFRGQPIFNYKVFFDFLYENDDPSSPISTKNWHPKLLKIDDSSIPNNAVAAQRAKVEAQKAALIYSTITLNSLPWPVSQNLDVYGLNISTPDEGLRQGKYLELGWTMACATGGATSHLLTRVTGS